MKKFCSRNSHKFMKKFRENSWNFKKMHEHLENKIIENLFYCSLFQFLWTKFFIRFALSLSISKIRTFYIKQVLHLQHNFVRQFKVKIVNALWSYAYNNKSLKTITKFYKSVQIFILPKMHSILNVVIDRLFLSHKQFNYVDLWS